jgi:deoxyribose-phosphate aldolase
MLAAIRTSGRPVGFKAAGGVKTCAEAAAYLALADDIMGPDWASRATFRFGASGLLGDVLAHLSQTAPSGDRSGY